MPVTYRSGTSRRGGGGGGGLLTHLAQVLWTECGCWSFAPPARTSFLPEIWDLGRVSADSAAGTHTWLLFQSTQINLATLRDPKSVC